MADDAPPPGEEPVAVEAAEEQAPVGSPKAADEAAPSREEQGDGEKKRERSRSRSRRHRERSRSDSRRRNRERSRDRR